MTTTGSPNRKRVKHVPKRTCVACRNIFEKRELIRLVATEKGTIEPDITGKKAGRGAYICRNMACWAESCKGTKLERALKTGISRENKTDLINWITEYLKKTDTE